LMVHEQRPGLEKKWLDLARGGAILKTPLLRCENYA
jgi:hypothetical protein